ncbi:hypothetical protein I3843_01G082300 [Carya illinoinensis]|uniref:Uncharacterized protein n=1 Tax=Carya illinoinensis TaxID=32201 RepID=A0A8T1RIQ5_CARIL|nr:uncharacterized protein LOC122313029 [Carya illinoinensis]KAG2725806.1 hypothetical protein I3760_01G083900 [Carya illinoinensis]KAG6667270.1 hypothetical protein CIPAW_01G090200 [Carya illinoinensis]KAG6730554.1 hypothetical protein I3842_01G086500 [Carya illinoinensis]KAG7994905.1 hypothetical protein I3843_01G082300 [Carya illinoinensis]
MARSLSQTLTNLPRNLSPKSRLLTHRTQSNQSSKPHHLADLAELTDSSSTSSDPLVRQLEDAIHRIIVRRSAPDWLPFLPGASYWVPPPPRSCSHGLSHLVHQLANPLSEEESMAITTDRGWPSSAYFIKGGSPQPVEVEPTSNTKSQAEDDEG